MTTGRNDGAVQVARPEHVGAGVDGLVALVTGGSRGIGASCATALGLAGATVVITATSPAGVSGAVTDLRSAGVRDAAGVVADVTRAADVAEAVDAVLHRHGRIDVLVSNAGIGGGGWTRELPPNVWDRIIDVNLNGTFRVVRECLIHGGMVERGFGRIISIASTGGKQGVPLAAAYTASKHGVIGMTKSLALEVADTGVTVNAVCPGFVETDLSVQARHRYAAAYGITVDEVLRRHNARIPIGRHIDPWEVARLVQFLADRSSGGFTGQAMNVCGGLGGY
jgi:ketoreductase